MASEFQILGYTDIAGFLQSNLTKRWQEMDVIFVSLLFSVCCMPSAFIVLSLILSGTHTGCYHSLIFIIHNGDFTITSSYSMWYQTPLHVPLFPQKTSIMSYWILVCKCTIYRQHYCVGLPQITVNFSAFHPQDLLKILCIFTSNLKKSSWASITKHLWNTDRSCVW